uniref:Vomeronasal type-1 receptor n=1 Tax=Cricetulus griseus TaxID=10029 RepID=A0A8C2M5G7_CRIGR
MDSKYYAIGMLFLSQTMFGIVGNFSLLSHYLVCYYNQRTLKPTDLILTHLTIANSLIILSEGIPQTMATFGLRQFFNDFGCKLVLYTQRVGRSMSIATTCLLSAYQATIISPSNSCWKDLKGKAPKSIAFSISLVWVIYMMINFIFPLYIHSKNIGKNMTVKKRDFEYCSTLGEDKLVSSLYAGLLMFPEVLLSGFMVFCSGFMVVILYRHKQQVQYIHTTLAFTRPSPESRATQSILLLVSIFLAFYTLSSILQSFIAVLYNPSWCLVNITAIISKCFPTICPFVMRWDSTVLKFCFLK